MAIVTTDDVQRRVKDIESAKGDDEVAHGMEDELWADVLETIASGATMIPQELARIALKTREIKFCRWCA